MQTHPAHIIFLRAHGLYGTIFNETITCYASPCQRVGSPPKAQLLNTFACCLVFCMWLRGQFTLHNGNQPLESEFVSSKDLHGNSIPKIYLSICQECFDWNFSNLLSLATNLFQPE